MPTEFELNRNTGLPSMGVHTFKILRFSEEMGGSGYPYIRYTVRVEDPGEDQGKEVLCMISLSPAAAWKKDQFLDALGAPKKGKATADKFVGHTFQANIAHELVDGIKRAVFDEYLPKEDQPSLFGSAPSLGDSDKDEEMYKFEGQAEEDAFPF